MKKILILFLLLLLPITVFADSGASSIVMDVDSGRILYQNNIHSKKLIASTTKIMTCIIVLENADLNKEITVGKEILSMYGTNIYIEVGEKIKIKDLLYGLMLRSGNDAAITLAVNTFSSEKSFVEAMNKKANEIGMKNTLFSNPHGLDENNENYSTAYDMALLSKYAYNNKMYREIISTKKYYAKSSLKSYVWYNRMSLINNYKYCIGGKNGYTPKAGKSLVSLAKKDGLTLTVVSLDDSDIYNNHINLYNDIFKKYKSYTIVDKNNFNIDPSISNKKLYIKESFNYPLQKSEVDNINTLVEMTNNSKIRILLEDKEIGEVKIYKKDIKKEDISIFQRLINLFIR